MRVLVLARLVVLTAEAQTLLSCVLLGSLLTYMGAFKEGVGIKTFRWPSIYRDISNQRDGVYFLLSVAFLSNIMEVDGNSLVVHKLLSFV